MRKSQCLLFLLKQSHIFYCLICMIVLYVLPSLYFYQYMVQEKTNQEIILSVEQILLAASFPFQITL